MDAAITGNQVARRGFALTVLSAHVLLVAALGGYYAKLKLPIGLYPTEVVVIACAIFGLSSIADLRLDRMSRLVVAFVAIGTAWVVIGGLGGMQGAGAKAFSFFVYSIFYFVIRAQARSEEARRFILNLFAIAAFGGVALGLWEIEFGEGFPTSTGSLRWLSGEFSIYCLFAAMVAAVPAILRRKLDARSGVVLGAAVAELILAQHRSAFVAFGVALGATAGLLAGSAQALRGVFKVLALAVAGVLAFTVLWGSGYIDETMRRISETTDFSDGTVAWRLLSWYEVGSGVLDAPWGHGFAHWDFTFNYSDPLLGSHNAFLDLTYRIGVEGVLVLLAMPVSLIVRARRLVQRDGVQRHIQLVTACACLLSFVVFASFNMALEAPYMSIMFWVALGVGAGALEEASP
ncbi:MAG: O-antigen ligase family protein [Deltaproteobacteria bacterium]|nr:O-antigen ligase family protein [Deltaproteobacteria bacterium]